MHSTAWESLEMTQLNLINNARSRGENLHMCAMDRRDTPDIELDGPLFGPFDQINTPG